MNPLVSAVNWLSSAGASVQFCAAELVFQGVGGEWNDARVCPADRNDYPRRSAVALAPCQWGLRYAVPLLSGSRFTERSRTL
jgi:hypothetical protein